MRHATLPVVMLLCALSLHAAERTPTDTLAVIHINDTHSALMPLGPRRANLKGTVGGIARAASVIQGVRSANPLAILLHAGDYSMGDISYNVSFGVPELRILRALGCDALSVGNHEWDMGPAILLTALDSAFSGGGFPLLSANTRLDDTSLARHRRYITPATILRRAGLKIGVFGLTTPLANAFGSPAPAYVDTPLVYAASAVTSLRNEGCRPIICLSHLGLTLDQMVAAQVEGIDLIVGGHDHRSLRRAVPVGHGDDTTWIVQTAGFYSEVGVVRLVVTGESVRLLDSRLIPVTSAIQEDPSVAAAVSAVRATIEKGDGRWFTSKVGTATATLEEESRSLLAPGYQDTRVGNLVADAFRDLTGTDIAIEPGGSTAQPIYRGPIVAADLFRVVGYGWNPADGLGYHLVRFDIQGEALIAGINFSLSTIAEDDEYFLQVSGMQYTYRPDAAPAERFVSAAVHGKPIDRARTYSVTANAFVAGFMGRLGIPLTNLREFGGDTTEYMALTRYVKKLKTIRPRPRSRILSVQGGPDGGTALPRPGTRPARGREGGRVMNR